ncbi:MAG: propionyl-CoA carboxylase carboxyltransferase subunit, partial [Clostridia bacterium]|nr:propionyl-CoA carboxylase carboxyltransferase subunit [Clostridia bacterium]
RESLIEEYKNILASPYEAAKRGYIDDIIEPLTARQLLISSFEMLADKQ